METQQSTRVSRFKKKWKGREMKNCDMDIFLQ